MTDCETKIFQKHTYSPMIVCKNAWMMAKIFLNFHHQFDARMGLSDRKVQLLVDKCPASPPDKTFLIKIIFLPACCMTRLQTP
jgi:hypothetical protein